jgi:glycogen operon protein
VLRGAAEQDDDLYVMINGRTEPVEFSIQVGDAGDWRRAIDTSLETPDDIAEDLAGGVIDQGTYWLDARSVVVLTRPGG